MFDEIVLAAAILSDGTRAWAAGSGEVVFVDATDTETRVVAHDGALLSATRAPDGLGMISGGDDGRLVLTRPDGSVTVLFEQANSWIEPVVASPISGFVACGTGKTVVCFDIKTPHDTNTLPHDATVMGLAFNPNGRRVAVAHKGGASVWYARGTGQSPVKLVWEGAHLLAAWSPDGRFVITTMHDNMLHGWKLDEKADLRMAGYPSRIKSLAWLDSGKWLATAGSAGAVIWPFDGKNGPMGRVATEVGFAEGSTVTCVCALDGTRFAAGTSDGRIWVADLTTQHQHLLHHGAGVITALAGREHTLIWGDDRGQTGTCGI
jgi:WD40 repeat protein